jgi:hypothetical protein
MTLPEAGKVASEAIAGLKQNPSCLAAILLAALFAGLIYIASQREAERSNARFQTAMTLLNGCLAKDEVGAGQ